MNVTFLAIVCEIVNDIKCLVQCHCDRKQMLYISHVTTEANTCSAQLIIDSKNVFRTQDHSHLYIVYVLETSLRNGQMLFKQTGLTTCSCLHLSLYPKG